ncbi:hypothetical protein [Acinetobacter pragensis]|uniref:Uncharacterized protein n=1 Tax=Acinetobacter pragensis TaxID=1806892 RepID=A0A151Y330_9GAMM|nr:hypothetical protein [Acinetobacter pragensis]KYQ72389.1 hypothetical protein AZH43_10660 [Acinetobacter pragensis]
MIKFIVIFVAALAIAINACVIFYWRDIAYDPSETDLILYLLLLPLLAAVTALAPYFIFLGIKRYKLSQEKKQRQAAEAELMQSEQKLKNSEKNIAAESRQFSVKIYSASAVHSFGENASILEQYMRFKSPELDPNLFNAYGLPVLSFRIKDLDEAVQSAEDDEPSNISMREQRIAQLLNQQIEQHTETLMMVSNHLKDSAMFYNSEMAYQYRMHPAWISEIDVSEHTDEKTENILEPVCRLDKITVHILLAENLIHHWSESFSEKLQNQLAGPYSILHAQIEIEHHFMSQQTSYAAWLKLLDQIAEQKHAFNLIINADSEIDQDWIDEKFWQTEAYIAAEYASSWCISSLDTEVLQLIPQKILKIALNETDLDAFLAKNQLIEHAQFKQDTPFVLILDDPADIKTIKKLQHNLIDSAVESHHLLYTKTNLGHTQQLAKIFSFMLGMHFPDEGIGMVYSVDQDSVYSYFQGYLEDNLHQ